MMHWGGIFVKHQCGIVLKHWFFALIFFYLMLFQCVILIGALVLLDKNAPSHFCFGAVFYDASMRKSSESLVRYHNRTPQVSVYVAHAVRCANVLCASVRSMVECASVIESS